MLSFIDLVLEKLISQGKQITNVAYVVPSRRVATFLSKAIATHIDQPIFLPNIYSIEEFIEKLSDTKILPDLDLLPLFYKSYLSVQPKEEQDSYDDFLGWAPTILKDFNEIDRYLVPQEDFFNYLGNVKELEDWHWSLGGEPTVMISKYLKFWKRLYLYYNSFTSQCAANNVTYQGLAYRTAHEKCVQILNIPKEIDHSLLNEHIVFLGLNALNTCESQIIQSLLDHGRASIFWDTDNHFLERKYHEAGKFIREYRDEWSFYAQNELDITGSNFAESKAIEIASVSGNIGMVQAAAHYLSNIKKEDIEKTVVVLADEHLLLPLLTALPDRIENYNVTMGLRMNSLPIASFIHDLIVLIIEKTENGFYFKNVKTFLESPFTNVLLHKAPSFYAQIIAASNLVYVQPTDLNLNEEVVLEKILTTDGEIYPVLDLIEELIKELKNKFIIKGNSKIELEQLLGLHEVMSNLKLLLDTGAEIKNLRTLRFMLQQLLPLKKLDFLGEPVKGLQIMGLLETRALDYKNVIMLSVNEGILPAGKSTASYIPFDMKRRFNLPTYTEKDSVYAYHFYRLIHRAESATYIYNTEPGKLGGAEKSRFLLQLETDKETAHAIHKVNYIYKNQSITTALLSLNKTDAYMKRLHEIAQKGFSPSALTSYVRNPIDFYKQKVLRVNELDEVEESIALNTMGSIVHETLDHLYGTHVNKELHENDFKEMRGRQKATLNKAYNKYYPSNSKPTGRNRIIYEVTAQFVTHMLQMDEKLIKEGNILVIKSVESNLSAQLDIDGIGTIKLHGTVDRVDQLNGDLRIIDYKTGAVEKGDLGLEINGFQIMREEYKKAKAFQILMYAYLYCKNVPTVTEVTAGMISFKKFQNGFISFGLKDGRSYQPQNINREILEAFEHELIELIKELFDPAQSLVEKDV